MAAGVWDSGPLEAALLKEADRLVGDAAGFLVMDDTALPKKGRHSVEVAPRGSPQSPATAASVKASTPREAAIRDRADQAANGGDDMRKGLKGLHHRAVIGGMLSGTTMGGFSRGFGSEHPDRRAVETIAKTDTHNTDDLVALLDKPAKVLVLWPPMMRLALELGVVGKSLVKRVFLVARAPEMLGSALFSAPIRPSP